MDCSWGFGDNACDGGEAFRSVLDPNHIHLFTLPSLIYSAYDWALTVGGSCPSEFGYGVYQMADGLCHAAESEIGATISGYVNVTSTVDAVLTAIQVNGPLAIAIDAAHIVGFCHHL